MNQQNSLVLEYIVKDTRYSNRSAHDLKVTRANMITSGTCTKYDLACIQYWIMVKEDRLPFTKE